MNSTSPGASSAAPFGDVADTEGDLVAAARRGRLAVTALCRSYAAMTGVRGTSCGDAPTSSPEAEAARIDGGAPADPDALRFDVAGDVEATLRHAEIAAVLHAGHFAAHEAARGRGKRTTAVRLAEATGCSRTEAHRRLETYGLMGTAVGDAFFSTQLTGVQARAIAETSRTFESTVDRETIDAAVARVIAHAGNKPGSEASDELKRILSRALPDEGAERDEQQRAARSAKLYKSQIDGMSTFVMTLPPAERALFEGLSARASAHRTGLAESAAKAGVPVEPLSHAQAFHDLVARIVASAAGRGDVAHSAGAPVDPGTAAGARVHHDPSGSPRESESATDVPASIVVRIGPGDLGDPGALVSTSTGSLVSVRDALSMSASDPMLLSARVGDSERLFRLEEIDLSAESENRLAGTLQRLVLFAGGGGCRFPGCDEPASRCQAHHIIPWSDGGRTELANLVLVCRAHHNAINSGRDGWSLNRDDSTPTGLRWSPNVPDDPSHRASRRKRGAERPRSGQRRSARGAATRDGAADEPP